MQKKNTEPYISTYLHQKGRKMGLPIAGNFELTSRCNFNCPMCYVHQTQQEIELSGKRELTAAEWIDIARKAKDMGMVFVLLTGGEPIVRKDFFEIYDAMREMGLLISINSNGSLLKGEILERFLKAPPFRFNISLYGGSNETYKNMCGIPAYEDVKENIRALRKAGVEVSLNLSITPYNKDDLEEIYRDAVELDVNVKASSYMYPPVRINGETYGCGNRLSAEDAAMCSVKWDKIRFTEDEFKIRAENMSKLIDEFKDDCPIEADEGVRCRAGSSSFWLTWDGKMLPCGMMTTPYVNVLETGFEKAWEFVRTETSKIHTPVKCVNCEYKEVCGVCAAVCFTETGSFSGVPEYICEKTKAQVRLTEKIYRETEGDK